MENKLTQKDFKIGQVLTCVKLNHDNYNGGDFDNERLILGEKYTITDLEYRFPDRVCVKLKGSLRVIKGHYGALGSVRSHWGHLLVI
jgi:hypothetical protein